MFGVLRGASCTLDDEAYRAWWSHICGLCLTLRDQHSQAARLTTNFDAALISVLYEAQLDEPGARRSSICPLRGFSTLDVVASAEIGARYASAVSLLIAAVRIADDVADGDGWAGRAGGLAWLVARRWEGRARREAQALGFAVERLLAVLAEQSVLEARAGAPLAAYVGPTETAVGAVFRYIATLAGRPENADPLEKIGRMYGRIMYLLDAVGDRVQDRQRGRFNALEQADDPDGAAAAARQLIDQALEEIRHSWRALTLPRPQLAQTLLLGALPQRCSAALRQGQRPTCRHSAAPTAALATAGSTALLLLAPPDGGRAGASGDTLLRAESSGCLDGWCGQRRRRHNHSGCDCGGCDCSGCFGCDPCCCHCGSRDGSGSGCGCCDCDCGCCDCGCCDCCSCD